MKHMYLQTSCYAGVDWHDLHTEEKQVLENGSPIITDIRKAIIDDVCKMYPLADRKKVEYVYDNPVTADAYVTSYVVHVSGGGEADKEEIREDTVSIGWDNKYNEFCTDLEDQFSAKTHYITKEIDDKDAIYIAVKEYRAGIKYGDTKERFFHRPFDSYEEAKAYIAETDVYSEEYIEKHGAPWDYGVYPPCDEYATYQVFVFDKNIIKESEWYNLNMKVIELTEELGLEPTAEFRQSVRLHLEALEKVKDEQEREERD